MTTDTSTDDTNRVLLQGRLSRDAEVKDLPSGDRLVLLRVVPRRPGTTTVDSIPVAVGPAPGRGQRKAPGQAGAREVKLAASLEADDRVRVAGRIHRRFWDAGGVRRSRLQVVAEELSRA
ncbi:MAG: hypothetical protein R3343_03870 [Nitriliruptorales bacterium]|nr:hypothetical protein [Nitriliruptorales bacterium]